MMRKLCWKAILYIASEKAMSCNTCHLWSWKALVLHIFKSRITLYKIILILKPRSKMFNNLEFSQKLKFIKIFLIWTDELLM